MEDSPFPTPSIDKPSSRRRKRLVFLFFAIVLILVVAYLGSRFLGGSGGGSSDITPTPSEFVIPTDTPAPTEEITSTPEPTKKPTSAPTPTTKASPATSSVDKTTGLDRADLKVAVQNGSGEKGVASKTSGELKDFGYDVVSSGNADNFDYTDVTIKVKSTKKDYLAILKKDLSTNYTIGSGTSDLDSSSAFDALVIVGK